MLRPSDKLNLTAPTETANLSVNDLAASFIAETIQAVDTTSSQVQAPVPLAPMDPKTQLAARQRRLEHHIAESKILMAQLEKARTKQEKDHILAVLRERSRWVLFHILPLRYHLVYERLQRKRSLFIVFFFPLLWCCIG
jgi:hypothetical protein